jgi:hypothetical protein
MHKYEDKSLCGCANDGPLYYATYSTYSFVLIRYVVNYLTYNAANSLLSVSPHYYLNPNFYHLSDLT